MLTRDDLNDIELPLFYNKLIPGKATTADISKFATILTLTITNELANELSTLLDEVKKICSSVAHLEVFFIFPSMYSVFCFTANTALPVYFKVCTDILEIMRLALIETIQNNDTAEIDGRIYLLMNTHLITREIVYNTFDHLINYCYDRLTDKQRAYHLAESFDLIDDLKIDPQFLHLAFSIYLKILSAANCAGNQKEYQHHEIIICKLLRSFTTHNIAIKIQQLSSLVDIKPTTLLFLTDKQLADSFATDLFNVNAIHHVLLQMVNVCHTTTEARMWLERLQSVSAPELRPHFKNIFDAMTAPPLTQSPRQDIISLSMAINNIHPKFDYYKKSLLLLAKRETILLTPTQAYKLTEILPELCGKVNMKTTQPFVHCDSNYLWYEKAVLAMINLYQIIITNDELKKIQQLFDQYRNARPTASLYAILTSLYQLDGRLTNLPLEKMLCPRPHEQFSTIPSILEASLILGDKIATDESGDENEPPKIKHILQNEIYHLTQLKFRTLIPGEPVSARKTLYRLLQCVKSTELDHLEKTPQKPYQGAEAMYLAIADIRLMRSKYQFTKFPPKNHSQLSTNPAKVTSLSVSTPA